MSARNNAGLEISSLTNEEFNMFSLTEIKLQATILKEFLRESNTDISQSSCLQALAKIYRFKDWNTMSAILKKKSQPLQRNVFFGEPIQIADSVFTIMFNQGIGTHSQFNEDAYRLLCIVLRNLKHNTLTIKDITRRSMIERWDQKRFDNALDQILNAKFIHRTFDNNQKLIITINPLYIWKGTPEKHREAIKLFDLAVASSIKDDVDISTVIALVENTNTKDNSTLSLLKEKEL